MAKFHIEEPVGLVLELAQQVERCNESGKQAHLNFGPNRSKLNLFKAPIRYSPSDGSVIAVKQLSSRSRQGNREFLNEFGMISCLQHQISLNCKDAVLKEINCL